MQKPANLRKDVWEFLLSEFDKIPEGNLHDTLEKLDYPVSPSDRKEEMLEVVAEDPAAFLEFAGIFEQPELLKYMIVEIDVDEDLGVDYMIPPEAVESIKNEDDFLVVNRLGDNKELAIRKDELISCFTNHCWIDYVKEN